MAVLITGGAGFIGAQVASALLPRQVPLILLDSFSNFYDPALKRMRAAQFNGIEQVTVVEGDIRDTALLDRLFLDHNIRRVINLAAIPGVRAPIDKTEEYFEVNTTGVIRLLDCARRYGVENFVQASSSSVYGRTSRVPFVEEDPADRPLAAYPASKRAAEIVAHQYHHLTGLNITCLRFFNVYGPMGRPDMMPMRVMQAIRKDEPITLFDGGKLSRDWTYIDDIVQGVITALDRPLGYEIINLGCGAPLSMTEFVDYLEQLSGKTLERVNVPAPPNEAPITYCDNSRARRLLGFAPTTPVRDGLRKTWDWFSATFGTQA